jgi:4-amino-4-deoxy-L-arabinose transferase-like glycosyltransferase
MTSPSFLTRRSHLVLLSIVVLLGAVLRFTALGQGIPFALGVDEPEIIERSVRMMKTGDFHPHFFDYPGLYIYIQFVTACVRFVVGGIGGLWANLNQAPPSEFYLWGRAVSALFGTLTVVLVYRAGRRISELTGLLAAAIFAVQSMHVRESHFVLTDVPTTFFVTLAWVLALRAHVRHTVQAFAWAGVAVGLAAATKYNGGVAILLPLLVLLIGHGDWRWRLRAGCAVVGGSAVAFLIGAPYTVLALPEFLNAFAYLSHMYAVGPEPPEPGWVIYYKHLRLNVSIPGLIAAATGVGLAVRAMWQAPRSTAAVAWATTTLFAATYFWMIAGQRLTYGRYLLPLLPFLSVLAGGALAWLLESLHARLARPRVAALLTATALIIVCWVPTTNSLVTLRNSAKVSTSKQAYDWVLTNVPKQTRIGMETRGILLNPEHYKVEYIAPRLIVNDFQHYQTEGYDYLLASGQAFGVALYRTPREAGAAAQYEDLFARLQLITIFLPSDEHPGPEWRIYRVPRP